MIYFDSAATTFQKPREVLRAVETAMRTCSSPGRGGYREAVRADGAVYECREAAAELFGAKPEQVVFTMNATHALNLAVKSLVRPGGRAVVSGFEHNAVMRPLRRLGARVEIAGRKLFDPADTLASFAEAVTPDTQAVICTQVSNVFGYRLPLEQIAVLCRLRGVPLIVDASQGAGVLPLSLRSLGAAFIGMPGHKGLYGPQGTGILLCGRTPESLLEGGTGSLSRSYDMPPFLPDAAEAGTHNVPGICGLAAGLRFVMRRGPDQILAHEKAVLDVLRRELREIDGVRLFEADGGLETGVLSFTAEKDCEETAAALARRGAAVRAGLHCAPAAHESAGTLESGTVRVSLSAFSTEREARRFAALLRDVLREP